MPRSPDEWADENRVLPKGTAEAGQWRSSRVPYLRAICQAAVDPKIKRLVMIMSSQSAKTECLLNIVGQKLDDDPAPVIIVLPTQRLATSLSQSRLMPMIRSTPGLDEKLDKRKSANKATEKFIAGQRLGLAWAGSATELSSHPAALILIDELDRMDADTGGEGDPVSLAEARTTTFPDGKVIIASTPTIMGASPIWSLFESGTQHVWSWTCPHCQAFFAPEFDLLKWPEKSTPAAAKREAKLMCPHCAALIEDRYRDSMNAGGKYIARGDLDSDTASFLVNGLASPWRSFGDAAKKWVEAARSKEPERMQAIMNTVFGQLWKLKGESPEVSKVQELRGGYKSDELPADARVITAGVDVQKENLYFSIRAWGANSTSWLLRYGQIWGATDQLAVWDSLAELLEETWGGNNMRIRMALVDSGYRPDAVYQFARRFPGRCYASKGSASQEKPVYVTRIELDSRRKTSKRGVALAHVDAGYFKAYVHGRIAWPLDQPGAWHLPADTSDDYCEQITAESRVVKANGAVIWVHDKRKPNHHLDTEALCAAGAHLLNVHLMRKRKAAPTDLAAPDEGTNEQAAGSPMPAPQPAAPAPIRRKPNPMMNFPKPNWTTGWR
jgi:phage terminase large subunit GpA-like protein